MKYKIAFRGKHARKSIIRLSKTDELDFYRQRKLYRTDEVKSYIA